MAIDLSKFLKPETEEEVRPTDAKPEQPIETVKPTEGINFNKFTGKPVTEDDLFLQKFERTMEKITPIYNTIRTMAGTPEPPKPSWKETLKYWPTQFTGKDLENTLSKTIDSLFGTKDDQGAFVKAGVQKFIGYGDLVLSLPIYPSITRTNANRNSDRLC